MSNQQIAKDISSLNKGLLYEKINKVIVSNNDIILLILKFLISKGFILSFKKILNNKIIVFFKRENINLLNKSFVNLHIKENKKIFKNLKFFSTNKQESFSYNNLIKLKKNKKNIFFILNTEKGLLSIEECLKYKLGGRLFLKLIL